MTEEKEKEFEPREEIPEAPQGIGGHKYLVRVEDQGISVLNEMIRHYDINSSDTRAHTNIVGAIKTLLTLTEKDRQDAINTMDAYQEQLVSLAGFLTKNFLTLVGKRVRNDIRESAQNMFNELEKFGEIPADLKEVWRVEIDRFIRSFGFKKFELLLAQVMSEDRRMQDAFDIAEDLVDNFDKEERVYMQDDGVIRIKEAILKRDRKKRKA